METNPISLQRLVGENIYIKFMEYKAGKILTVKLVGHEPGGIWIESKDLMEDFYEGTSHTMSLSSMQYFVPFQRIVALYHVGGGPWVSEKVAQ
jgi:hypothetical protein